MWRTDIGEYHGFSQDNSVQESFKASRQSDYDAGELLLTDHSKTHSRVGRTLDFLARVEEMCINRVGYYNGDTPKIVSAKHF
jgi:hypothetical protein